MVSYIKGPTTPDHVVTVLAGLTDCCDGCRKHGPVGCTCWRPVFDLEQTTPSFPQHGPVDPAVRDSMCHDCAYRPGSPEKSGHPDYKGDAAELDRLARVDRFWCHQGMRRPLYWEHPAGVRVEGSPADYDPPIDGFVPYKADGTPAELCSGWDARRRALTGKRAAG